MESGKKISFFPADFEDEEQYLEKIDAEGYYLNQIVENTLYDIRAKKDVSKKYSYKLIFFSKNKEKEKLVDEYTSLGWTLVGEVFSQKTDILFLKQNAVAGKWLYFKKAYDNNKNALELLSNDEKVTMLKSARKYIIGTQAELFVSTIATIFVVVLTIFLFNSFIKKGAVDLIQFFVAQFTRPWLVGIILVEFIFLCIQLIINILRINQKINEIKIR